MASLNLFATHSELVSPREPLIKRGSPGSVEVSKSGKSLQRPFENKLAQGSF